MKCAVDFGLQEIEQWMIQNMGDNQAVQVSQYELFHAHILFQANTTQGATAFSAHQDNKAQKGGFAQQILYSAIVKLNPDEPGRSTPSRMNVAGAAQDFEYGKQAGSGGFFDSRLWHRSRAVTEGDVQDTKIVYFFRREPSRSCWQGIASFQKFRLIVTFEPRDEDVEQPISTEIDVAPDETIWSSLCELAYREDEKLTACIKAYVGTQHDPTALKMGTKVFSGGQRISWEDYSGLRAVALIKRTELDYVHDVDTGTLHLSIEFAKSMPSNHEVAEASDMVPSGLEADRAMDEEEHVIVDISRLSTYFEKAATQRRWLATEEPNVLRKAIDDANAQNRFLLEAVLEMNPDVFGIIIDLDAIGPRRLGELATVSRRFW